LLFLLIPADGQAAGCLADKISERVTVVRVYDGDTVKLTDGRRVRLIGINTPELGRERKATQPFAAEARRVLQTLLDRSNRTLLLQYGQEHHDHYGRLLAHVFLDNGENVAVHLLQKGLATALVVPPNTWAVDCYRQQEDAARIERRGIWGDRRYQSRDSNSLPLATRDFSIVHGQVTRVKHSGGTLWIELQGPLAIRIGRKDRVNFPAGFFEHLAGQRVEVRGWVRPRPSGLVMTVRHPAALVRLAGHAT
jgi:endonuclease YncB( thermonuclease family)